MNEPTNKTYELTTLADLFDVVTLDNVRTLAGDLKAVLFTVANAKMVAETMGDKATDLRFNPVIRWTDDNVQQSTLKVYERKTKKHILNVVAKPQKNETN